MRATATFELISNKVRSTNIGPKLMISHLSFQGSVKLEVGRDKIQLLIVSHFIGAHPRISRANITKHKTAGKRQIQSKLCKKTKRKYICVSLKCDSFFGDQTQNMRRYEFQNDKIMHH